MKKSIKVYKGIDKLYGEESIFAETSCGKVGVSFYIETSDWINGWDYKTMMDRIMFVSYKSVYEVCDNPEFICEVESK